MFGRPTTRHRRVGAWIVLALALAASRPAFGQLLSWGVAAFRQGNVRCTYAVYADRGSRGGYWIRIWGTPSGTVGILNIGLNSDESGWRSFTFVQYETGGRHFTLQGGADQPSTWREVCWGQLAIALNTVNPQGGAPIINAACSGFLRVTHYPTGFGHYRQEVGGWTDVTFTPMGANWPALTAFLQQIGAPGAGGAAGGVAPTAPVRGLLSWGIAAFNRGSVRCTYAVYADPGVRSGYWIRIWGSPSGMGGIMNIGGHAPDEPPWRKFNYVLYETGGRHFTLQGGMDEPSTWRENHWGQMFIALNSVNPPGGFPIVSAACSGFVRSTHIPTGFGHYRVEVGGWADVVFNPTGANWPLLAAFLNQPATGAPRGGGGPTPPRLTNVVVNKSPVQVRIWDHGQEDGDIVQLFINGKPVQQLRLTRAGATLSFPLAYGQHRLDVRALNEGSTSPNTASISISGVVQGNPQQRWSLKTGQTDGLTITVGR